MEGRENCLRVVITSQNGNQGIQGTCHGLFFFSFLSLSPAPCALQMLTNGGRRRLYGKSILMLSTTETIDELCKRNSKILLGGN